MTAESRPARLSEEPVPPYQLPDPLRCADGTPVTTAAVWRERRRPELLELFRREVYGRPPAATHAPLQAEVTSVDRQALDGAATRKEVTLWFDADRKAPPLHVLLYVPNGDGGARRWPALLGLNFYGNHTVHRDPGITLTAGWVPASSGVVDFRATEAARGTDAAKWQVELVVSRGYAVVTAHGGELCPDRSDGLATGLNAWLGGRPTEEREPDAWGAIGVWAWALSRVLDHLETDADIDARRVAVHGHSRLGKAALWAGAQDERFAAVIANESGCGGAALSKRVHGETVAKINALFPHWFARNFRAYGERESALPVDQHELLVLIAPRPLHVASAEDDDWADPRGEFLAVVAAEPVYRLLGRTGPGSAEVPPVDTPVGEALRYHVRTGGHGLTAFDWEAYLNFADRWLGGR